MKRFMLVASLATLGLTLACKDKDDDTGGTTDGGAADGGTADGGTADGGTADGGSDGGSDVNFTLSGNGVDLASGTPAMEGLCVRAINPDPAVTGGEPITMSESTIGAAGAFTLTGVDTKPAFGILVSIYDCESKGTVLATATPVMPPLYADIAVGGEVSGLTAFSINAMYADGIDASLAGVGFTGGSIWDIGGLMGGVWDSSFMPLEGAVVTGASTVYYQDGNPGDSGLFATTGALNTSTVAAGSSLFLVPAAGIGGYSATLSGYTFPTNTLGSSPGSIIFAPIIAE